MYDYKSIEHYLGLFGDYTNIEVKDNLYDELYHENSVLRMGFKYLCDMSGLKPRFDIMRPIILHRHEFTVNDVLTRVFLSELIEGLDVTKKSRFWFRI